MITLNPATEEQLKVYKEFTLNEIEKTINDAHETFLVWKSTTFGKRAELMHKAADILDEDIGELASMITTEMGKTLQSAKAEIEKCAWVCRYYADHAERFLEEEIIDTDASKSKICFRPLGVVLAVMPWNYPFWQVFRFAAPALMAGNVGLLKHASNVTGCALKIQEVFKKAGFPEHAFQSLIISSSKVEKIINHNYVQAATLTGSEPAGAAVASESGSNIKKTVLELGGSDPYIVLKDANLDLAVDQCTQSRLLNSGQSCIGAKRFIVVKDIYNQFLEQFIKKMASASVGDPMDNVDLGPMARKDLRDQVHQQVTDSVKKGARLELGGQIPNRPGAYYPPTILTKVAPGMPAYEEEIFGPVASVIKVKDEKEAIRIANDTKFGLGACVFTEDLEKGERIAEYELEAGCCFVNQYVKSDPRLPFGGIKTSGYGRELSYFGIREFTNVKTVYIK
ncbi:NAD-dependent succinate-semialdehyde dehydrogenase [Portibacter marinus]|uniref:NAD-dependent succinate-semialdehyde dehydrogenase n=1 Tax=Portibacter marinus TaxID=2898660 RepID=UPI003872B36F